MQFRWAFLAMVLVMTPGYRFRCFIFCTDQTAIQHDYVEQRDRCREYAQLRMTMTRSTDPLDDAARKTKLIELFSECMAKNGWTMSDAPKPGTPGSTPGGAPTPAPDMAVAAAQQGDNRLFLSRAAECAFARQAASYSTNSAARAKACDIECAERLRAAPDAPRPAACPAESPAELSRGGVRDQ